MAVDFELQLSYWKNVTCTQGRAHSVFAAGNSVSAVVLASGTLASRTSLGWYYIKHFQQKSASDRYLNLINLLRRISAGTYWRVFPQLKKELLIAEVLGTLGWHPNVSPRRRNEHETFFSRSHLYENASKSLRMHDGKSSVQCAGWMLVKIHQGRLGLLTPWWRNTSATFCPCTVRSGQLTMLSGALKPGRGAHCLEGGCSFRYFRFWKFCYCN